MFSKLWRKEKPRVYLGKVVVAPRSEAKKIDQWGLFKSEDLEDGIRRKLDEVFSLPQINSRQDFKKNDLALDVIILNIQGGELDGVGLVEITLPIFWRPKIEIAARLYYADSGKTHTTFKAIEKMPWSQYLSGAFSMRGLFRFKPMFGVNELEPLLYRACEKLLTYMAKAVY